jgi:hypothetical protein
MDKAYLCGWIVVVFGALLDRLQALYRRHDRNLWEGDDWSHLPWISWGWIVAWTGGYGDGFPADLPRPGQYDFRYFTLRLPSFEWSQSWNSDSYGWMQRVLFWFQPRGWRMSRMRYG